jgi:transposase
VWLSHRQTINDVIDGFEAAWVFFGGVFGTMIPDNLKAIVIEADPLAPRLNEAFVEYAQARGFHVDPIRVRAPTGQATRRTQRAVRAELDVGQ